MSASRGQAAIEYISTYGWMLLVLAVTMAAFYALTSGRCMKSDSGFGGEDIRLTDFGVTTSGELQVILRNAHSETLVVEEVRIAGSRVRSITPREEIPVTQEERFSLPGFEQAEGCRTLDVEVRVSGEVLGERVIRGSITGPIGME